MGHAQALCILKPAFGGVNESLVACGSEDSCVYIWNKEKGEILTKLEGHTQIVNMVHWNPTDPYIFASASDDTSIRIWGLEDMEMAEVTQDNKEIKKYDATVT
jgi:WD40 repeat protein